MLKKGQVVQGGRYLVRAVRTDGRYDVIDLRFNDTPYCLALKSYHSVDEREQITQSLQAEPLCLETWHDVDYVFALFKSEPVPRLIERTHSHQDPLPIFPSTFFHPPHLIVREQNHILRKVESVRRRLRISLQQRAMLGWFAPPYMTIEIEDARKEIAEIKQECAAKQFVIEEEPEDYDRTVADVQFRQRTFVSSYKGIFNHVILMPLLFFKDLVRKEARFQRLEAFSNAILLYIITNIVGGYAVQYYGFALRHDDSVLPRTVFIFIVWTMVSMLVFGLLRLLGDSVSWTHVWMYVLVILSTIYLLASIGAFGIHMVMQTFVSVSPSLLPPRGETTMLRDPVGIYFILQFILLCVYLPCLSVKKHALGIMGLAVVPAIVVYCNLMLFFQKNIFVSPGATATPTRTVSPTPTSPATATVLPTLTVLPPTPTRPQVPFPMHTKEIFKRL
jgi:hypothetical protein